MKRDKLFVAVLAALLALDLFSGIREGWPGFWGWFIWPWY